jgi:DNA processing protein
MNEYQTRLAFGGMAPRTVDRLLETYGDEQSVVAAICNGRTRASTHTVAGVRNSATQRHDELTTLGVRLVGADEDGFPERLKVFPGHPRWLFMQGEDSRGPAIGIVGTRTCTRYGIDLARAYGQVAALEGWSVVSGLARGIDGAAHLGATMSRGHCQAILGSGIDVVYPRSHKALHTSVLETGGVVMSEFPPGTPPEGWRFPTRNRIIAGLSDVLLVVEAGVKGGALITARIALDYGVPVYAVPGDVDRVASVGTNLLIRDGAFPILGAEDLAEVLALLQPLYGAGNDAQTAIDDLRQIATRGSG